MRTRLALLAVLAFTAPARAAEDVSGLWMTEEGDGAVLIAPCGEGVCGRIVWLKSPLDESGQPVRDENNTDASQRDRFLCGLEVIAGARPQGDGWEGGSIYDPESGTSYSLALRRSGEDTVAVTGFVGLKALGKTFEWHRAPASLKRCDAPAAAPPKARAAGKGS